MPDTGTTSTTAADPPQTEAAPSAPLGCTQQGTEGVSTDRADYPPESTVHISGSGYASSCTVRIEVTRPDGSIVRGDGSFTPGSDEVQTSVAGSVSYAYRLDGIEGLYRIRVVGDRGAVLASATFTDQLPRAAPSDPRAAFVPGNVVTCLGAGFPRTTQMGSPSNTSAADNNVSGTVGTNAGAIQPGTGQEVNVTILQPDVVIDAVVVKGSNGYNVYANPAVLPPALLSPQHYISPLTDGSKVPTISHWFVCYHLEAPPPPGSLTVQKIVIPPNGRPVVPLPVTYTAVVACEGRQPVEVTFGPGGGPSTSPPITGLLVGTVCRVTETGSFPTGSVVTYDPLNVATDGIAIPAGNVGVTVSIINDFTGVAVQTAQVQVTKEIVLPVPPGVQLPTLYNAHLKCDDGTDVTMTLPSAGGAATPPVVNVAIGSLCGLEEDIASLPPGWIVTYTVGGDPPGPGPAVFTVLSTTTIAVTITNDPTGVAPTTTTNTTTTTTTTTASGSAATTVTTGSATGSLPATGVGQTVMLLATAVLLFGLALLLIGRRDQAGE